jgi:hypothetical protein
MNIREIEQLQEDAKRQWVPDHAPVVAEAYIPPPPPDDIWEWLKKILGVF